MLTRPAAVCGRLLLFAAVGVLLTIAVAWTCEWLIKRQLGPTPRLTERRSGNSVYQRWDVEVQRQFGDCWIAARWFRDAGSRDTTPTAERDIVPKWASAYVQPDEVVRNTDHVFRFANGHGWPLIAMWSGREYDPPVGSSATVAERTRIERGWLLPTEASLPHSYIEVITVFPTGIVWRGFLADTIFYGLVTWLALFAPGVARRIIRHHRGRCPK